MSIDDDDEYSFFVCLFIAIVCCFLFACCWGFIGVVGTIDGVKHGVTGGISR